MMRKIFAIFSLILSVTVFAQVGSNAFSDRASDNSNSFGNTNSVSNDNNTYQQGAHSVNGNGKNDITALGNGKGNNGNGKGNGGNAGDPVPVDSYIPVLVLIALGIIVNQKRLQKASQS